MQASGLSNIPRTSTSASLDTTLHDTHGLSRPPAAMKYLHLGRRLIRESHLAQHSQSTSHLCQQSRQQCRTMAAARAVLERSKDSDSEQSSSSQKAKALDLVMGELNSRFGKGSIMKLGSSPQAVECIPTGALTLDIALGGGFPKGRIIEIYGPESSGKTTLALHAIATVQKNGGTAALVDAEHAFDPIYSKRAGVDVENLVMCQPDNGEMALEVVDQLVRSSSLDIIAVDSVAALTPKAEIEGEIGQVQIGAQARLMSAGLRKLSGNAAKCNTTVIFINQLRQKIGVVYGNPEVTTGGNALKFYASVRLDVRRIKMLEGASGEHTGIKVKAKVVKNKVAPPFKVCEFDIMFGSGISTLGCLVDAAEKTGILKRKGSWYSYNDKNIGQGRDKTLQALTDDPSLASEIETRTRQKLSGEIDINELIDDGMGSTLNGYEDAEADVNVDGPEIATA